jgi:plasmid stabilization system protein ParE
VRIEWSVRALADLDRFAEFLREREPSLARRIAAEIRERAEILAEQPHLGRRLGDRGEYRQVILQVAKAAYIFHYRVEVERLVMLRVFHGREMRVGRMPGT